MANLVRQAVEPVAQDATLVLYFDAYPSRDDVVEACKKAGLDTKSPCFEWNAADPRFVPAGQTKVVCWPSPLTYGHCEFENQVLHFVEGPDPEEEGDESEEHETRLKQYPVCTQFCCTDFLDGNGWGRSEVEKHAKVLEVYPYDVGSGDESYAVTVLVENEKDFLFLLRKHEQAEKRLPNLYG